MLVASLLGISEAQRIVTAFRFARSSYVPTILNIRNQVDNASLAGLSEVGKFVEQTTVAID